MRKSYSFDLNKALAAWRRSLEYNHAFTSDDLDELEQHLRDQIAGLVRGGLSEEQAFARAMREMGDYSTAEAEYRKVYWGKLRRRGEVRNEFIWRMAMLKNYLKITVRTLARQKGYAFINIAGLVVGLAVCFLIFLFVRHELSFDRFHAQADQIYRVVQQEELATSGALAPALESAYPDVVRAVRISQRWPEVLVTHDGEARYEQRFFFTDSTFFDVFNFPLVQGDPRTALTRPFSVVLTEEMARKYFGKEDPVGQTLNLKGLWDAHDFEVTGVVQSLPSNSHFTFNFLASYNTRFQTEPGAENIESWRYIGDYTYLRLDEEAAIEDLAAKMPAFAKQHEGALFRNREDIDFATWYTFQPITDIHLYSQYERELEPNSEVRYLYIFSAIALLILLIACINYVNLATARSAQRAREVGVRKVVGAHRSQLIGQFMGESVAQIGVALLLALLLVKLSLPAFNNLLQTGIRLEDAAFGQLAGIALGIGAAVVLLAGLYPATVLSRFRPAYVLKGNVGTGASNARFRHGLVVVQFAASVVLIIGTLTIQRQLDFMQEKKLGLNPEQVVVVSTRNAVSGDSYTTFKEELLKHPDILSITASSPALPARPEQLMEVWETRPVAGEELPLQASQISVGLDFLETMEIPLVKGRNLRPGDLDQMRAGTVTPVLINETAARHFGWTEPIGKEFGCCHHPTPRVVGVVEDFHYQSLKEEIDPLVLSPTWWSRFILVRVSTTDDLAGTLAVIEDKWQTQAPDYPFDFTFLDERFAQIYDAEERLAQIFAVFSALAVLIACLGLFGLAAFMAQRRTKEIGIRKVLGATVVNIVSLLSKDLVKLVGIAFVVAAPLAYLAIERWLSDFAYHIDIGPGIFVLTVLLVLLIAGVTVSYQSIKAALTDPVKSLRHE
ncbi:MAG TPA: ABC transporter permease [Rhodothermales bacterium]|nr:ABC transporter permease [Rhodothermales bacterium]